ncbi:MAG: carboxypeptidase regulatory-like domain-containing protein [Planctomycetes bacterium]|nr:carboxypeptidase regulatory-like domain-containing protein [Planctomycetota bacterium]
MMLRSARSSFALLAALGLVIAALVWELLRDDVAVSAGEAKVLRAALAAEVAGEDALLAPAAPETERWERQGAALVVAAWSEPVAPSREELLRGAVPALRGRVVEAGGEALPHAELWVQLDGGEVAFAADATGAFALELPPASEIALIVRAEGFLPARFAALPFEGERELALDRSLTLRGRVVDAAEGEPIAGAELVALRVAATSGVPRSSEPVQSDRSGMFAIEGLGPGDFELRARANGFAPARLERVALRRGNDEEIAVALQPELHLLVRVLDDAGEPLSGAAIQVRQEAEGGRPRVALEAASDARGEARFTGLAAGGVRVVARSAERAAESAERELAAPAATSGEALPTVELRLSRGILVLGVVRDPEGRPAAGAAVVALGEKRSFPRFAAVDEEEHVVRSDAEGAFRLQGLRPGAWKLCSFDGDLAYGVRELRLDAAVAQRPPKPIEIQLAPPFGVRGTVLDAMGKPVTDVAIEVGPEGARDALGEAREARSDADGNFELGPFPRVPLELLAEASGFREARERIAPPKQAAIAELRLVLRGAHGVRGRVVDTLGRAVGPARIDLVEELSGRTAPRKPNQFRGRSDAFGEFFVPDVLPGAYGVRVQSFGHAPLPIDRALITLPGDEEVSFTLEILERAPTGTLVGLVRSSVDGGAPASYRVDGVGLRGGSVSYGAQGRFQWSGIEAGMGGVEISSPRHARRHLPALEVWGGGKLDLGVVMLELGADLAVGTRLHSTDRDEARKLGVERELRIEVKPLDAEAIERGARAIVATGKEGAGRIEGLLPGKWEVIVRAGSGWVGRRTLELAPGEQRTSIELMSPRELAKRREAELAAERRKRAEQERAKRAAAEAARKAAVLEAARRAAEENARKR